MKRLAFALIVAAAVLVFLAGCMFYPPVSGSGTLKTQSYSIAGFSRIQASQSFEVRVVPAASFSVTVSCDDNLDSYLQVEKRGLDTLSIGLDQGYSYFGVTLVAVVHMPSVSSIDGSGASRFKVDPGFASANRLAIMLSGASTCTAPSIACGDLTVDISGASTATLAGNAGDANVLASGASHARLIDCAARSADVDLSGASDASVDVQAGSLSISASGASTLYYAGYPALHVRSLSGTSRAVKAR
jgi:hypothetical protein